MPCIPEDVTYLCTFVVPEPFHIYLIQVTFCSFVYCIDKAKLLVIFCSFVYCIGKAKFFFSHSPIFFIPAC